MNEQEAEKRMIDYLKSLRNKKSVNFPAFKECLEKYEENPKNHYYARHELLSNEHHLFIINERQEIDGQLTKNYAIISVNPDGTALDLHGACADVYYIDNKKLGAPLTGERWIGSGPGRYQLFKNGIVKWEAWENLAYPASYNSTTEMPPHKVSAYVAFIDIRGFTKWAIKNEPNKQYELLNKLENILQEHFDNEKFSNLFLKGTGDGFMIVQEEYVLLIEKKIITRKSERVEITINDFIEACLGCCKDISQLLKNKEYDLGVGIGIDFGKMLNIWMLGRWDYIGDAVNNASKLQAKANDEVIISKNCYDKIKDKSIFKDRCKIE